MEIRSLPNTPKGGTLMRAPIKLQEDKLVIDPSKMEKWTPYQLEYQGRIYLFVKTGKNIIDVYEVIEES